MLAGNTNTFPRHVVLLLFYNLLCFWTQFQDGGGEASATPQAILGTPAGCLKIQYNLT